jgi:methyl-accepting chemotaxis protein
MVMQLDTRASELKVDGYKALVRSDPEAQLEELAGDVATADELLAVLEIAELSGETAEAVDGVVESFGPYTDAIGVFIDSAIADQAGTMARWEEIQVANDITDGAVGAAKDLLISESIATEQELTDTIEYTQTISLLIAAAALVLIALVSWLTLRSIKRPVERVKTALEALATGDLTVATGVTSRDEVGQMAAALDSAQTSLREVLSSVVSSADAVAASSEELSASSAQISASAEETSAQSGVVAGAAEEVSRNVQTVAAGA